MPYFSFISPKKFRKKLIFLLLEIILILSLGSYLSLIFYRKAEKEREDFISGKKKIEELSILLKEEASLKGDWQKIEKYYQSVVEFLPQKKELVKIVHWLENLADKNDLKLKIKIGEKLKSYPQKNLKSVEVESEIYGNLKKFISFCKDFENSPYFLKMKSLKFKSKKGIKEKGKMEFKTEFLIRP